MIERAGAASAADLGFVRGQTVCVTGATGALGPSVAAAIDAGGAQAVVRYEADIRDRAALDAALGGCSAVVHLAGISSGATSDEALLQDVNVAGTRHAFDAAVSAGVRTFIFASTGHVYGAPAGPATEDSPVALLSPYAASKLRGEQALAAAVIGTGVAVAVARLSNVYGERSPVSTVVGRALDQALSGRDLTLRNLASTRDFIYVDDAAEGMLRLGAVAAAGRVTTANVSTGRGARVSEIAAALVALARELGLGELRVVEEGASGPDAAGALVLSPARLLRLTGWSPRIDIHEGLRRALQRRLLGHTL